MKKLIDQISRLNTFSLFLICLVISIIFRAITLKGFIIQVDESDFSAQGALWAHGGIPYLDFVEKKPPLSYAFYALTFKLFSWNLTSVHLVMIVWISLTAIMAGRVANLIKPQSGNFVSIIYCLSSICSMKTSTLPSNTENMLVLPSVICFYFFLLAHKKNYERHYYTYIFFASFFAALASLFKHQGGIMLAVLTFCLVFEFFRKKVSFKKLFVSHIIMTIGFLIPWFLFWLYFYFNHAHHEFLEWNFLNNARYISASFDWTRASKEFLVTFILFSLAMFPSTVCVVYLIKNRERTPDLNPYLPLLFLWLGLSYFAVCVGGRFASHYYIQIFPPFFILAGLGLNSILTHSHKTKLINMVLFFFIAFPSVFSSVHWLNYHLRTYEPRAIVIDELESIIKDRSSENDRIFVWGYFSYPYYRSQRLPATRFIICEYIVPYWEKKLNKVDYFETSELTPWHLRNIDLMMEDLQKHQPKVIIDTTNSIDFSYWRLFPIEKFETFHRYVQTHYQARENVRGMVIYERLKEGESL